MTTRHSRTAMLFSGMLSILVLLAGTAGCGGGGGATPALNQWFISPEGNDSSDCHTPLAPCLTIGEALDRAVDGDVIYLAGGNYNEALSIDKDVTITGELADIEAVIDGSGLDRSVINMNSWEGGPKVELHHLTLANGDAANGGGVTMANAELLLQNVTVRNNHASANGGGIIVYQDAQLTIDHSFIEMNGADGSAPQVGGGGIYNMGVLVINNSVIQVNQARDQGGGLHNGGEATLNAVIFTGNETRGQDGGGAIFNTGTLTIQGGEFQQNKDTNNGAGGAIVNRGTATLDGLLVAYNVSSSDGGGIANEADGVLTLTGSTLANNEAAMGGGLSNNFGKATLREVTMEANISEYSGGAIMNSNGATLNLVNVTISGNSAGDLGGGIGNGGTDASVLAINVTIAGNSAANTFSHDAKNGAGIYHLGGMAVFVNVLLADNPGSNCGGGAFKASGLNLSSDATCAFDGYGNLWNVDPQLEPLADNGGRTETHALRFGSPAIDAGTGWLAPETDQRDVARPLDGNMDGIVRVDLGAFEFAQTVMGSQATMPVSTPDFSSLLFIPLEDLNCRGGPGLMYPVFTYLENGEEVPAEGRDENMIWFRVRGETDMLCWVMANLGSLNGDPAWLPQRDAPPTPIPYLPGPTDTPQASFPYLPGPTETPVPQPCAVYTTSETCLAHACKWLDGSCRTP